ncbi:MAG: HAMP domain-containing sensor histidine kinase, partial [Phycisphaerae bacterium]|nr:HAMP domain-containing sensor histidine kinase [Phycisphaerae bacterium]
RRGAFVSAVTHEMRTPLTTFRMYAEMLAEGMLTDEAKRRQYLGTLRREADRLGHLVENVLAYARLDGGRPGSRLTSVTAGELLDETRQRLAERAEEVAMDLVVEAAEDARMATVRVDRSAVEQILFNLVDNSCKYAASASDQRIHIEAHRSAGGVSLRVRDHGPGIADGDAKRLFRAFSKSARDAAHSAPGVGLGLALSRRLARSMGGELSLETGAGEGAAFVLTLPGG